ncbi:MAG: hypothetical protein IPM21_16895 [Acidobacteria bacterium]|nr:hypothetical protein [Acidobacteriota bacterium]
MKAAVRSAAAFYCSESSLFHFLQRPYVSETVETDETNELPETVETTETFGTRGLALGLWSLGVGRSECRFGSSAFFSALLIVNRTIVNWLKRSIGLSG